MIVPDTVRKSVVFIGYRQPTGEMSLQGTAFFVFHEIGDTTMGFTHLVTAAHVIQKISDKEHFDGKILIRANAKDGKAYVFESNLHEWKFHPTDSTIDVAVLPFVHPLTEATDTKLVGYKMFFNEEVRDKECIGLGDEVFLTGLFINHHGRERNIPIIRAGNIAAMPEEKVYTDFGFVDAYLIEARSIGGLSGSPVFVHLSGADKKHEKGGILIGTGQRNSEFWLLGLMHGHYKLQVAPKSADIFADSLLQEEAVNMGIAIVIPSERIMEVLTQSVIKDLEDKALNESAKELAPTMDSADDDAGFSQRDFDEALKKASQKVSEPDQETNET